MTKLKLGTIADDKPAKLTIELPAAVHRNLIAYADAIGRESGQPAPDPAKIVAPKPTRGSRGRRRWSRYAKAVSATKAA